MASKVEICNRALQKLGAKRITSLTEDSKNARACNVAFEPVKLAELRSHPWAFAIKRATLAADATAPDWGRQAAFQLPSDFLRKLKPYPEDTSLEDDSIIEGQKIYTDQDDPYYLRYIADVTDPNVMDPLFREALAARLALELCEEIVQSNILKAAVSEQYKYTINEARRTNAIEKIADQPPEDQWITIRK